MRAVKPLSIPRPTTDDPELAERFNLILEQTVEAMESSGIRYAFIGGIASSGLGRPRSTHDIDLFVRPEDAEIVLRALSKAGFRTEKTDPSWLYKGFKEGILVDVIFKSKGEIYFDSEMHRRMITAEFHGKRLRLVAPEDLLIIKAAAHSELTPNHWHDAIALLTHANMDWDYLLRRARRAPRRILSLLLYAQSNDIWVPNWVVHELYQGIFGGVHPTRSAVLIEEEKSHPVNVEHTFTSRAPQSISRPYAAVNLRQRLAEDERTNELDIRIEQSADKVLLRGDVPSADRKKAVEQIAAECCPGLAIESQIRVLQLSESGEAEEVK